MNEIWKDINGYEGLYQVSNLGNVRSIYDNCPNHLCKNRIKIIKQHITNSGYLFVQLHKNKIVKNKAVHRLVAEAFIENNYNLPQVNHKDEDKFNNNAENLEWCTCEYNNSYGTKPKRQSVSIRKYYLTHTSKRLGTKLSEATRKKMREARKRYLANKSKSVINI